MFRSQSIIAGYNETCNLKNSDSEGWWFESIRGCHSISMTYAEMAETEKVCLGHYLATFGEHKAFFGGHE